MSLLNEERAPATQRRGMDLDLDLSGPTVWVVIQVTGGNHNRYEWDPGHQRLRLQDTPRYASQGPIDRGRVLDTSLDGAPLELWLVRSYPIAPETLVEVRVIGVTETVEGGDSQLRPVLLGVPIADSAFSTVFEPAHLPPKTWQALADMVGAGVRWSSSDEAAALLRESRRHYKVGRAYGRERGPTLHDQPVWQSAPLRETGAGLSIPTNASETVRFSRAEYAFHTVPLRFQKDLAQCLLPDERILFFAYRPEFTIRRNLLRRQRYLEGLVVVTDRQILWLVDAFPQDATMIHWGYNAHSLLADRLVGVSLAQEARHTDLALTVSALGGNERLRIAFPGPDVPNEILPHVERFVPGPGSRALRRVTEPRVPKRTARWLMDETDLSFVPAHTREALQARRDGLLALPDERVLTQALAAPIPDIGLPGRLVTVTPYRLLEVALEGQPREFDVAEVSSVQMQYSLWGAALAMSVPDKASVVTQHIRFNSPQQPWFQDILAVFSQCMSAAYSYRGTKT